MRWSKVAAGAVAVALVLVSIEVFVEALLGAASQPAILAVLTLLAAIVAITIRIAVRRGGPPSTPYW